MKTETLQVEVDRQWRSNVWTGNEEKRYGIDWFRVDKQWNGVVANGMARDLWGMEMFSNGVVKMSKVKEQQGYVKLSKQQRDKG